MKKREKKKLENVLMLFLAFSSLASATSWTVKSESGRVMSLEVNGILDQTTQTAIVCAAEPVSFKQVKLWMPAHNHGSSPTSLTAISDRCARVNELNFVMPGSWELRVLTTEGDKAVFVVELP